MFEGIADKTAKILVVEPAQAIRNMIVEVLREAGFRPQSTPSLDDAVNMLGSAHYDWIIAGIDSGKNVQPRDLLLFAIKHPELRNLSISLMIDEQHLESMPDLFALGLLSYHVRPFTKASFATEVSDLLNNMYGCSYKGPMVAANNLRSFLIPRSRTDEMVTLDESIASLYPVDVMPLKNLINSLRMAGRYKEALATVTRAELLDDNFAPSAKDIKENIMKDAAAKNYDLSAPLTSQDVFGFPSIVILDNDEAVVANAKKTLAEGGATDVQTFADGDSYWNWQKENPLPSLILMEWRLPKVSGAKLIQRISGVKKQMPPAITIQSSQVTGQDLGLLKELGVTSILQKPWKKTELVRSIIASANSKHRPTTSKHKETRLRALMRARKTDEATKMVHSLLRDPQVTEGTKLLAQGELALLSQNFSSARDFCMAAMKVEHDQVHALHTLGKALLGLTQYDVAIKCFERAQKLSPVNVERLCLLATAESEAGNGQTAKEHVNAALQIDAGNETVQETDAQVSLANGDTKRAANILETLPSLLNVVAYQNNRAVALAKTARVAEAVNTYRKTIEVLPEKARDTRSTVQYNLALSYVKSGDLGQAQETLLPILKSPTSRVYAKAKTLSKKINQCIADGTPLALNQNEVIAAEPETAPINPKNAVIGPDGKVVGGKTASKNAGPTTSDVVHLIDFQPGSRACFQIFRPEDTATDKLQAMLRSLPRFAIQPKRDKAAS